MNSEFLLIPFSEKGPWTPSQLRMSGCVFVEKGAEFPLTSLFISVVPYKNKSGEHKTQTHQEKQTSAQQGHKQKVPQWFTHSNTFVYLSCLKWVKVWSVALAADRRELVFVIKTHRPNGELVLWDHVTLLGSTIFGVTFQNKRKMRLLKVYTHW